MYVYMNGLCSCDKYIHQVWTCFPVNGCFLIHFPRSLVIPTMASHSLLQILVLILELWFKAVENKWKGLRNERIKGNDLVYLKTLFGSKMIWGISCLRAIELKGFQHVYRLGGLFKKGSLFLHSNNPRCSFDAS